MTLMLKPWVALSRLRPARLYAVGDILQDYAYRAGALRLYRAHLPELLTGMAGYNWPEVLSSFLHEVNQRDWLPVDWADMENRYQDFLEDPRENSEELAHCLEFVPLTLYGLSPEDGYSPLNRLSSHSLASLIDEAVDSLLRDKLRDIEVNPPAFPEPLRWLPVWVRWAEGLTGNLILDRCYDDDPPEYRWTELEKIKQAWQEARPIIDCFERRFVAWYNHNPASIAMLVQCLVGGVDYTPLNW